MKFTLDKSISYEDAVGRMFEMLGNSKIMALASSLNDYVMVRNVSCLFYDDKIYFKTDKNFRKTKQLLENPRVAMCWSGVQVEGTREIKAWWWRNREEDLRRDTKNICGRAITNTVMKIQKSS